MKSIETTQIAEQVPRIDRIGGTPVQWRNVALCIFALAGLFLLANHELVTGKAVGIWDADAQFLPYYVLVADAARNGSLIYWDPWTNAGLPFIGEPQTGALSPLTVFSGLITGGTSSGFIAYWLALWFAGGAGMVLVGRQLGAPLWAAFLVGAGFLFSGVYTGNAEHTSWIAAFSPLPFIIWRIEAALRRNSLVPAVQAGAIWGLSALSGYPGIVMLSAGLAVFWVVGRLATERSSKRAWTHGGAAIAGMVLTGLVILAPVYLAFFYEGAGVHSRVEAVSREVALGNAMDPGALITLSSPYFNTLKERHRDLWPGTDVSMVSVYIGAATLLLALFALIARPGERWRWWLAGGAIASLMLAVGEVLPLRGLLYDLMPPTRFLRHTAMFRLPFLFFIAVLALAGARDITDAIRNQGSGKLKSFAWTAAALAVVSVSAVLLFPLIEPERRMSRGVELLAAGHAVLVWGGLALAGLAAVLPGLRRFAPLALLIVAAGDAVLTARLSKPTLSSSRNVSRWNILDGQHSASFDLSGNGWFREGSACPSQPLEERCKQNDQLITRVPVLSGNSTQRNPFHAATVMEPSLRETAMGSDRVWFSEEAIEVLPVTENFEVFLEIARRQGLPPLVVHSPESMLSGGDGPRGVDSGRDFDELPVLQSMQAELHRYSPEEIEFSVYCEEDGWVLLTDRWARSWKAQVNGRAETVYGGNFIFRALRVSAGENRIRLRYEPLMFPWVVILSWGALAAVGFVSMYARSRASL